MRVKHYFRNLWYAIKGDTGFCLHGAQPNTYYVIKTHNSPLILGHIQTDEKGRFIPFIRASKWFLVDGEI